MPKVPDGEMTRAELVRLVKKYNEKMGIDPKGKSRDQLIEEIESLKYKIDHVKKDLVLQVKQKTKKQPRNVKADPIKQKTELQKQKAAEKKEGKEMEKKKELRKVKKEVADKIINREKRVKDKSSKNSTTKMKGKEDQIVDFYGKTDKKFKDPPVTKQQKKKIGKKQTTKDFYKLVPNDDEAKIDEIDSKKKVTKRTIVKLDNLFDALVEMLEERGYSLTPAQKERLEKVEVKYSIENEKGRTWHISQSKGKTDMLILSMPNHEFGAGNSSIRVKKKV